MPNPLHRLMPNELQRLINSIIRKCTVQKCTRILDLFVFHKVVQRRVSGVVGSSVALLLS